MKKVFLVMFIVIILLSCSRNASAQQETLSIGDMLNSTSSLYGKKVPSGYYDGGAGSYYSVDSSDPEKLKDKPFIMVTTSGELIDASYVMYLTESTIKVNSWLIEGMEYLEANGWVFEPLYSLGGARLYSKSGMMAACATEDMGVSTLGMITFTAMPTNIWGR